MFLRVQRTASLFNLLPTHCGYFRLLLFPRVQRTASITQLLPTHCGQCAAPGCLSSVLRRASTSTGVLGACVFSLCRTFFATATGCSIPILSCPPSTLALEVDYIASAPAVYAAPAPAVRYITSAQSVSYAAPARVLSTLCQRLYPTAIGGFGTGCMLCLVPLSGQFPPHSATPFVIR